MKVIEARPTDSDRLIEYFANQKVEGAFDYLIERRGSFFDKYKSISDEYRTLMLVDRNEIEGVATLVFKPGLVQDQPRKIGFALDLRVSPTRRAILHWAELFFSEFERVSQDHNCELIFSSVERYESQAYNALIRPQRSRRSLHRYYLFWKYYTVGLYGLWPFAPAPLKSLWVEEARAEDLEELAKYLDRKNQGRLIRFSKEPQDFERELFRLSTFQWKDLLIARDHHRRIVGCLGMWNSSSIEQLKILNYKGTGQTLYQGLYLGSFISKCHRLPPPDSYLKARTLTPLYFDNTDIFYTLLRAAWERIAKDEIIIYNCYKGDYSARPPASFISSQIPHGVYTVLSPQKILPDFLRPNPWIAPPEFDLRYF